MASAEVIRSAYASPHAFEFMPAEFGSIRHCDSIRLGPETKLMESPMPHGTRCTLLEGHLDVTWTECPFIDLIEIAGDQAVLQWTTGNAVLETASNLSRTDVWQRVDQEPHQDGGVRTVRLPLLPDRAFYRLRAE